MCFHEGLYISTVWKYSTAVSKYIALSFDHVFNFYDQVCTVQILSNSLVGKNQHGSSFPNEIYDKNSKKHTAILVQHKKALEICLVL